MTRHFWVLVHRYAGLYMAFFLTVAGLTGSILAFHDEIDHWLNPERHQVGAQNKAMLDGFALREKALALEPRAQINEVSFNREPGQVYEGSLSPLTNPRTNKPFELGVNTIRLNPYNGELIGFGKDEGFWPPSRRNILGFIYALHYSLAMGEAGSWLFGSAALIWTVDCFVGFYLTLPRRRRIQDGLSASNPEATSGSEGQGTGGGLGKGFCSRWAVAWKIKWPASSYRFNFDLHRAGGLWTWVMLFVFAWSSVFFNLRSQVYQPVMSVLFGLPELSNFPVPDLPQPHPIPNINLRAAYAIGRRLMDEQAQLQHFQIINEESLVYVPQKGLYAYTVKSDRDISDEIGSTVVYFDGDSGAWVSLFTPSGQNGALTFTLWLVTLHMGKIWGLPFQIFVCLMGLVVAMLSGTGVYIWLKKLRAKQLSAKRQHVFKGVVQQNT